VDLSWRMTNAGWKCKFVPQALAYHGRGAGSNPGGYKKVISFIKFHRRLSPRIREMNYKNHIFMYVKNSRRFSPQFFFRELAMFCYVLLFETSTLKVLPDLFRLLPKMWKKRKLVKFI
jgi:GT2 family glycosyltransferase